MTASCPDCRSEHASVRYDFGAHRILRCAGCELLYLDPQPTEEETRSVYGEDYFQNPYFSQGDNRHLYGYVDYAEERFNKQPQYARIAREIAARLGNRDRRPRLLEVGCGLGYFLDVAFEENFDVVGLEFNPHAVARLRRKYAFPILSGPLEETEIPPVSLDAIVLFDVIEHLRNPFAALDQLHQALAKDGLLVLSTVDAESLVSRLIGKRLEDFRRTREHLVFFSRKTLTRILREHGFEVLTLRSVGHTFDLDLLLERLSLYNRPLFGSMRWVARRLHLANIQVYVNPFTKMIAFARRLP
jgi:SAM-dependent methyltransferase